MKRSRRKATAVNGAGSVTGVGAVHGAGAVSGAGAVKNVIGSHLYLERDGRVLLGLRHPDSAYAPLEHHFLAGHREQESAIDGIRAGRTCTELGWDAPGGGA
ncbi:hypothetical protein ACWFR1_11300 [Streptomyces sp. NPDC055103]